MAYAGFRHLFQGPITRKTTLVQGEQNLPAQPPFIVAVNHVGFMDGPALVIYLHKRYRRKLFFLTHHFFWKLMGEKLARRWLGMIPIRSGDKKRALDEVIEVIRQGEIVGIFPEGTRNTDERTLLKGKTGAVRLALATKAPLIPIGIRNTTGHGGGAALKSLFERKTIFTISIGSPVDLSDYYDKPIDKPLLVAATTRLMKSIGELCGKEYPY